MPFIKRFLTGAERASIDFNAVGVIDRRIPYPTWKWAVDLERGLFLSELNRSPAEGRDHDYWHLLLIHGKPLVFCTTDGVGRVIGGRFHSAGLVEHADLPPDVTLDAAALLAGEGMEVLYPEAADLHRVFFEPLKEDQSGRSGRPVAS